MAALTGVRRVLVAARRGPLRRLRRLLGPGDTARQSLIALGLNSSTSLVAGAFLGSITGTFESLPGLLVLVPAAIGLRGNIFSTFGSRLSTAIHTGTFQLSTRPDSVLGQNVSASMILTLAMSLVLAVVAKVIAVAVGVEATVSVWDLALISIVGGLLASLVVLLTSIGLAAGAVRFGWDLDNVVAPIVSTLGDVLTLPALYLATFIVAVPVVSRPLSYALAVFCVVALIVGLRTKLDLLRQIVRQATPVLFAAVCLSTMAGIVIESRLEVFSTYPALLILLPAFISSAGALGGILSSRLSSKLHLGALNVAWLPDPDARADAASIALIGAPIYLFNAVGAHFVARLLGQASPGLLPMIAASMIGGLATVLVVVMVAYYATIVATTIRVDPDTYGIPIVTSSVDFAGAVALISAVVILGVV